MTEEDLRRNDRGACKDCLHWTEGGNNGDSDGRWPCHTNAQRLGKCEIISRHDTALGSAPLAQAVRESEGVYGELITDANFGCVLFKRKNVPLYSADPIQPNRIIRQLDGYVDYGYFDGTDFVIDES